MGRLILINKTETETRGHMVKCHENAYSPKNLSLFAFNIEGYWGLIKQAQICAEGCEEEYITDIFQI